MDGFDIDELSGSSEEDIFMSYVVAGEPQLLFLDTYMRETFGRETGQEVGK